MIELFVDKQKIKYKSLVFSGGEIHPCIETRYTGDKAQIKASLKSSNEIFELLLLTDALRRNVKVKNIELDLFYLPYGRQDRVCSWGDAFGLKVFADIINSANYDKVRIYDPHSDVSYAVLNNCEVVEQINIISNSSILSRLAQNTIPVSPDAGANKKVQKIASMVDRNFIRADKIRRLSDGQIIETKVFVDDLKQQNITIYDDICDGGRTFIELAKALKSKNCGEVNLYVTHGIFSKGLDILLNNGIDRVYTTNSFNTPDGATIINL